MADVAYIGAILPVEETIFYLGQEIPVVFEVVSAGAERDILRNALQAWTDLPDPDAVAYDASIERLARAIVSVRGKPIVEDLAGKIAWVHSWPDELVGIMGAAYASARDRIKTERRTLDADPLPAALSADENGDDSGPGTSTGHSRRKTPPTSSITPT